MRGLSASQHFSKMDDESQYQPHQFQQSPWKHMNQYHSQHHQLDGTVRMIEFLFDEVAALIEPDFVALFYSQ